MIPLLSVISPSNLVVITNCLDILLKSVPDEVPNAETQAAIDEVDNMVRTGKGEHFSGTTEELFKKILSEPDGKESA